MKVLFQVLDVNGDGGICVNDLTIGLKKLGVHRTEHELMRLAELSSSEAADSCRFHCICISLLPPAAAASFRQRVIHSVNDEELIVSQKWEGLTLGLSCGAGSCGAERRSSTVGLEREEEEEDLLPHVVLSLRVKIREPQFF
ncbi:hypothetical protein F2P81_016424 [Scophthalmus maximus]|uniref:EF-hand domain-containing protein n=1 Tax=Scophthalmus maximus TaxID=52904 RepID=A0A6A4SH81_SCOMX|nr:hypothetical protein F2P81_016424 [Scophthalmus maximus]